MFRNPLEEHREGRGSAPRALRPLPKKSSLRALRAHNVRTYNSGASCAGTRRVPFVGCSSLGPETWVMELVGLKEDKFRIGPQVGGNAI